MQSLVTRCEHRHNPAAQRNTASPATAEAAPLSQQASHHIELQQPGFSRLEDAAFIAGSFLGSLALFGTCYVLASVVVRGVAA